MYKNKDDRQQENALYGVVDERTKSVVYQGDAYTGRFMLFAVLIDVFLRGPEMEFSIYERELGFNAGRINRQPYFRPRIRLRIEWYLTARCREASSFLP